MAIANFFDKAALGAAQILKGVDADVLTARLVDVTIAVAFDAAATSTREGRIALEMSVNLLSRFYPRLSLWPLDDGARVHLNELAELARTINPDIELAGDEESITFGLVVGETAFNDIEVPALHIGSYNWIARVSKAGPVGSGDSGNPCGAAAAACLGAANAFRYVFRESLLRPDLDEELSLSLFDFEVNEVHGKNPEISDVNLDGLHIVGAGAIGNAVVWTLARTSGINGRVEVIDHEAIDLSNLQRYVLATQSDIDVVKVVRAVSEFSSGRSSITATPHKKKWGEYRRDHPERKLERIAVALDSAEDRRAVQASLPERVANAWTQVGDLGVSRHYSFGKDACLVCLYFPSEGGKNLDEIVSEAVGLPEATREVRELLHSNAPVERSLIERMATAAGVPVEPLLQFEGRSLYEFYTRAVCGGMIMNLGGTVGGQVRPADVPMAFQSAMAGVMLAAELVADAGALRSAPIAATTRVDLLHPIKGYLNRPEVRHPSGRCICHDVDYVGSYRSRYRNGGDHD